MQAPSLPSGSEDETAMATRATTAPPVTEEKGNHFWGLLPSFDPSSDDPREYVEKVKFLHGICPERDRNMLGPRLAMLMKGTAWSQICKADPKKLADPIEGIKEILTAVATWEESEELQTYERFEKALFRVMQKSDESVMSYVNRMQVSFRDLGEVSLEDMKAFVLLRQSCLTAEDKKKVITMTGGVLEAKKVEQAMRQLSTRVIVGQGEQKKKTYPVNLVEEEEEAFYSAQEEEMDEESALQAMCDQGDEDALLISDFEDQLVEACQDNQALSQCFTAYAEARDRLRDRMRSRGFWPPKKGGKAWGKGRGKKGGKGRRMSLAEKIANSHCRNCGMKGHWKMECPQRSSAMSQIPSNSSRAAEANFVYEEEPNDLEIVDEVPTLELMNHLTWNQARKGQSIAGVQKEPMVNEEFIGVTLDREVMTNALVKCLVGPGGKVDRLSSESVFSSVDFQGSLAILDTGASKTVIGKKRVADFLSSLHQSVRERVHWRQSETVFRFGNNGTLKSLGALFLPFGKRWMRIEVVGGETPFLLSNAFIRSLSADILASSCQLWLPDLRQGVELKLNKKGLYLVDLSQILKLMNSGGRETNSELEVVTYAIGSSKNLKQTTDIFAAADGHMNLPAKVAQSTQKEINSNQCDKGVASSDDGRLCSKSVKDASLSGGRPPSGRGSVGRDNDCSATGDSDLRAVGPDALEGRSSFRNPVSRDGREGSSLLQIHSESSQTQVPVVAQPPELPQSMPEGSGGEVACTASSPDDFSQDSPGDGRQEFQQRMGVGWWSPVAKFRGNDTESVQGQTESRLPSRSRPDGTRSGSSVGAKPSDADRGVAKGAQSIAAQGRGDVVSLRESTWEPLGQESALTICQSSKKKLDFLEVYCFEDSRITQLAQQRGLRAQRFTMADGDLSTEEGRQKLWRLVEETEPEEIWVSPNCYCWGNYSRYNMQRSQSTQQKILQNREVERENLVLCEELYVHQVSQGRQFHMEQPLGSEAFDQPKLEQTRLGTLKTVFDMCEVGKLKTPHKEWLRKRTVIRTTSRSLHEALDARYCRGDHVHKNIAGKIWHLGKWINLSEYTAKYSLGFASCVVDYLLWVKGCSEREPPLEMAELCIPMEGVEVHEQWCMANDVVKRRRLAWKQAVEQAPGEETTPRGRKVTLRTRLKEIFQDVEAMAPRVGTVVVETGSVLFEKLAKVCETMKVVHVEVCRGTERLRLPKEGIDKSSLTLRQTIVMHRSTGECEILGKPENWQRLAKRQQVRKSVPARLCITVFGSERSKSARGVQEVEVPNAVEGGESSSSSSKRVVEAEGGEPKRHKPDRGDEKKFESAPPETDAGREVATFGELGKADVVMGYPPKIIARHGPAFEALEKEQQEWLKQVHHRMGHPDAGKFAAFLRDNKAAPEVVKGSLDMQCDSCAETKKGFALARSSTIHEKLAFNDVVGMDTAQWTNAVGERFNFMHVVDEGTMYQLARPCREDAVSQLQTFEDMWTGVFGAPKVLFTDPAKEYTSEVWMSRMQEYGTSMRVTATDSHWQLGRTEAHGSVVKAMLTRVDKERPIRSEAEFKASLIQVCSAKNSLARAQGYSPEQAVLGISPRLPASVISCEDAASQSAAADVDGERFRQRLELRCLAQKAFVETDNCNSMRRALLRRVRPIRTNYEIGDWVLYWRRTSGNMRRERGKWYGPARVAVVEGNKVVWLSHGSKLVRASPEQIRPATLREWKGIPVSDETKVTPQEWLKKVQNRNFFDLGEGVPEDWDDGVALDEPEISREISEGSQLAGSVPEPEAEDRESRQISPEPPEVEDQERGQPEETNLDVPMDGTNVPVPEETEDLLFGDHVIFEAGGSDWFWELDVSPSEMSGLGDASTCLAWEGSLDDLVLTVSDERKKKVEVKLSHLSQADQHRFAVAKHKELGAWLNHKTVRKVAKGQIPEHAIMRCRWLLSWKQASGNEPEGDVNAEGLKAKARLVVIGFEDPGIGQVCQDAPTLSKDGRSIVLQMVSSRQWELVSFDVSTAFLHGKGDGRLLGLHPTVEMQEMLQMGQGDQCRLDGGAYGRVDAPFLWFQEFKSELEKNECYSCPMDPCVFVYAPKDECGRARVEGCLGVHVDDGIGGGSEKFLKMLDKVASRFKFGSFERREFTYTGIHFKQWDDKSIEYDQIDYVGKIKPICVQKERRMQSESPVTEAERTQFRSLIGALQYAGVHSRPDLCARIGELQATVTKAVVNDLLTANKLLQEAKENPMSLMVLPIRQEAVTFCAFSDASFSALKHLTAHQGTLIVTTTPELLENGRTVIAPVAWCSKKIPRVVRSTLGAEAAALANSVDRLFWIRLLWCWAQDPFCKWQDPETCLKESRKAALVTDCKSAFDLLTKTALPQCAEHRTTVECLLIRERLRDNCVIRWVASQAMLSDCLTKSMDPEVLRACLKSGKYSLQDEQGLLRERADKRQRLKWVMGEVFG